VQKVCDRICDVHSGMRTADEPRFGITAQTRTTVSCPAVARCRPLQLNAAAQMTPVWASSSCSRIELHSSDI